MASSVKPGQRAFALTIALIFLVTTIATSALVVWSIIEDNKSNNAASDSALGDDSSLSVDNANGAQQNAQTKKLEGFTPVEKVDTLQKIDLKEGNGRPVSGDDKLTLHYIGAVASTGNVFQSSYDLGNPIKTSDPMGNQVKLSEASLIPAWIEGVPGMKVGGKRRLIIPAEQAYGANPPAGSGIPANAALVFDIELVSID